ncbi:MAG: hypothetical protein ACRDM1_05815 [Gaiellaceae bacterium]
MRGGLGSLLTIEAELTLAKLRSAAADASSRASSLRSGGALHARYLDELDPVEISAWRMTVSPGYRFEATQALRQVLARAVLWGMLDANPAKQGVENPQRRRWEQLDAVAERLGPRLGPMAIFAAATGMRPGE